MHCQLLVGFATLLEEDGLRLTVLPGGLPPQTVDDRGCGPW